MKRYFGINNGGEGGDRKREMTVELNLHIENRRGFERLLLLLCCARIVKKGKRYFFRSKTWKRRRGDRRN